jgi:hypothetical protein
MPDLSLPLSWTKNNWSNDAQFPAHLTLSGLAETAELDIQQILVVRRHGNPSTT